MAAKKKTEEEQNTRRLGLVATKVGRVPIMADNFDDAEGNPAGGFAQGVGFEIVWQNGVTRDADGRLMLQTGAFVEDVVMAVIQRMEFYQRGKFASDYNAAALEHLNKALVAMESRRRDRENRGVDGRHEL